MNKLSHLDNSGKARMVDVGGKDQQIRTAIAEGAIYMQSETLKLIRENQIKKGDALTVAEIAGIQAAKKTHDLIPLCHPLQISCVEVITEPFSLKGKHGIIIRSVVKCRGRTGVEMEALTAVSVALLTVYDMCKAADKDMKIDNIRLIEKKKE